MSDNGYQLRPIDLDDGGIEEVTRLLELVFPKATHFTKDVVKWQYVDNPDGHAIGYNAWQGKELAGHYVTIPLRAFVFGKEEKGLLSLNTATHPSHRGKGLFTKLAKATYERAALNGYGFVVGVANANSTHGFIKKLGFQLVSPLRAMVGVGPIITRSVKKNLQFTPIWDERKLSWRLAHPKRDYTCFGQNGCKAILSDTRMKGFRFLMGAAKDIPLEDLPRSVAPFRKAYIGLDPDIVWKGRPYINVPKRFRQAPLNLIFKDLTGQGRELEKDKVRFQALDFDTL